VYSALSDRRFNLAARDVGARDPPFWGPPSDHDGSATRLLRVHESHAHDAKNQTCIACDRGAMRGV